MFFEKNLRFLKKHEINVDVKGAFSLYFFGGFCYKEKWTVKRGGLDGQSRAKHNKQKKRSNSSDCLSKFLKTPLVFAHHNHIMKERNTS